ncbi:hypothetical protein C347_07013 [Cryptococcus neoformans AD2-60a]|nr:hypothetical protein C347_07013 [Cryptococcus neoformans var. grubii AD2-60a]OXC80788.1 hypothetical protein C344_06985 [Cryptococcus neoformans var. grubii AD1-7a]OXG70512.1 hypothetical protein C350_07071 [Cryptococcus neoformans var. grubii MW-RSA36]OXH21349.1 hypothetical protein J005_07121 [Cryptococcus neoformans var. grubii]
MGRERHRSSVSVSELRPYYKPDQPCGALNQEKQLMQERN